MAGGDMRIRNEGVSGLGQEQQLEVIDANSARAGDYSEARTVGGQDVFLTAAGAQAFDALAQDGFSFFAEKDPAGLRKWLLGDRTGPKGEQFQGSLEQKP